MFKKLADEEIGEYIGILIDKSNFKSRREFCKNYLVLSGDADCEEGVDEAQLANMSNRLSQIIKGKKSIQTYDLPIFSELLGVSCDCILSCGKEYVPPKNHKIGYEIAISKNPDDLKEQIKKDSSILSEPDEYGETFLDYVLKNGNYELIKYMIENR